MYVINNSNNNIFKKYLCMYLFMLIIITRKVTSATWGQKLSMLFPNQ